MGECLKLDQPKRKLSGIKDEEKTSSLENKTAKVLYPVDLLLTDRDNDSNGRQNEYYDSICSVDKDDVETRQCQYCNTQIQLSSYNVLRSLIFTDVFGEDSHGTLLLKCWNCKEIKNKTIAIYLNGQWWETEDILKSATHRKDGWSKVTNFGERIALFVLNCIIFNSWEIEKGDIPYSYHTMDENARLLWYNNTAIGFYTYNKKGSSVFDYGPPTYEISVIDTIFIRKQYRLKGFGTSVLVDFLRMNPKENIGLSHPVSNAMMTVCHKYLYEHPNIRDRVWRCIPPAGEKYRSNMWLELVRRQKEVLNKKTEVTTTINTKEKVASDTVNKQNY